MAVTLINRIRLLLWIFIVGLMFSGATAIPLETELKLFARLIEADHCEMILPFRC